MAMRSTTSLIPLSLSPITQKIPSKNTTAFLPGVSKSTYARKIIVVQTTHRALIERWLYEGTKSAGPVTSQSTTGCSHTAHSLFFITFYPYLLTTCRRRSCLLQLGAPSRYVFTRRAAVPRLETRPALPWLLCADPHCIP